MRDGCSSSLEEGKDLVLLCCHDVTVGLQSFTVMKLFLRVKALWICFYTTAICLITNLKVCVRYVFFYVLKVVSHAHLAVYLIREVVKIVKI